MLAYGLVPSGVAMFAVAMVHSRQRRAHRVEHRRRRRHGRAAASARPAPRAARRRSRRCSPASPRSSPACVYEHFGRTTAYLVARRGDAHAGRRSGCCSPARRGACAATRPRRPSRSPPSTERPDPRTVRRDGARLSGSRTVGRVAAASGSAGLAAWRRRRRWRAARSRNSALVGVARGPRARPRRGGGRPRRRGSATRPSRTPSRMIVAASAAVVGALSRKPSAIATIRLRMSSSDAVDDVEALRPPNRSRSWATCSSSSSFGSRPK